MPDPDLDRLTEAQRQCLRLIAQGLEIKEIAAVLGVSPSAVVERLRIARQRLGVATSKEAARRLLGEVGGTSDIAYTRYVDTPHVVAFGPENRASSDQSNGTELHERQAPFDVSPPPTRWPQTDRQGSWLEQFDRRLVIVMSVILATAALAMALSSATQTVALFSSLISPTR